MSRLPDWCKNAKIAMIEQDLTISQLADRTGMARPYVSSIVNGRVFSENAVGKICDFLNIPKPESNYAYPSSE